MGASDTAALAELKDWVEGLRVAAHKARGEGHITLADALGLTETSRPAEPLSRRSFILVDAGEAGATETSHRRFHILGDDQSCEVTGAGQGATLRKSPG
jgi:hypothetical protein